MNPIQSEQTILFVGDSITDCGRRGAEAPYGSGYVGLFRELMTARYPDRDITVVNKGIGGNTVEDLAHRWEDDVVRHEPDWLSIKVGINDLHRTMGDAEFAVPLDAFASAYDDILQRARDGWGPQIVLVSPFYISRDTGSGGFRSKVLEMLPGYIEIVEKMAAKHDARYVPLQDVFMKHLEYREPDDFCPEPVHPHRAGHLVIAEAIIAALEG